MMVTGLGNQGNHVPLTQNQLNRNKVPIVRSNFW